jgi:hypothetical protein
MPDPTTPYKPFTHGRGQAYILPMLEKNLLKIGPDDTSKNNLILPIMKFTTLVKKLGEIYGLNELPSSDKEDIDTMIVTIGRTIDRLKEAGKEKKLVADSNYGPTLDGLKNENKTYSGERTKNISLYKNTLTVLSQLRETVKNPGKGKNEIKAALESLETEKRKLTTLEREFNRLKNIGESLETRLKHLKLLVVRDASIGPQGPKTPTPV